MMLGARTAAWAKSGGRIPSGWVKVEYIESDGVQLIDTGLIGTSDIKIHSKCALVYTKDIYPAMWGARKNSKDNDFQIYYNVSTAGGSPTSFILRTGRDQKQINASSLGISGNLLGAVLDIETYSGHISVNRHEFTTPSFNFTTPHSISMFCEWTIYRNENFGAFRYYIFEAWRNGSQLISLIPVRNATTNEGAMCDILTGDIYHNAGTGAFIIGPDKTT